MATAASAFAAGAVTDQAPTTTTFQISPSWTLGGTATKMPFHIWAKVDGASSSGTALSLQLVAPTAGELVTIYRGTACRLYQMNGYCTMILNGGTCDVFGHGV